MDLNFHFSQVFGDSQPIESIPDSDIISSIEFNSSGKYLAAGDRGGRVIIFKRSKSRKSKASSHPTVEYKFFCEFQSHESEFDSLRSVEIGEAINCIEWVPFSPGGHLMLLSTNDKTVKLWRVAEKHITRVTNTNLADPPPVYTDVRQLKIPRVERVSRTVQARPRHVFSNASNFRIHSLTACASDPVFATADDLRISIWDLEASGTAGPSGYCCDTAYNVVDIKPEFIEDLSEVITSCKFHPTDGSVIAYGTSKGAVSLADLRSRATCHGAGKAMGSTISSYGGLADLAGYVTGMDFSPQTNTLLTRDFLNVRVWDVRSESKPLSVIPVQPQLRTSIPRLLETEDIFDRFKVSVSPDGKHFCTGSYSDRFHVCRTSPVCDGVGITATRQIRRRKRRGQPSSAVGAIPVLSGGRPIAAGLPSDLDPRRKILHHDWCPGGPHEVLAVATTANLFLYCGVKDGGK